MKLTRLYAYPLLYILLSVVSVHAQNAGGAGGSQSQSAQTLPGQNPPPSTASTPAAAVASGTAPGTATTSTSDSAASTSSAATTVPDTATAAPAGATMSTIVVTGATEGSVLPIDQSVSSVYGSDLSVQDTPRTVTVVNSQMLQDANIQSMADFVKVAPSAYTTDQYGVANVPTIRGQLAEVYINGMQRITRSDGPPTSFNSVEQADVVAGPASSIYGPTSNVGGYVNLVTKQPYFDRFHDDTDFTYGSYNEKKWTEDFGAPIIKNELAYRVSYEGDYSGSYYNNEKTNTNDGFVGVGWIPTSDFRVDFNTEFFDGRYNENSGTNRPTQGLISGGQYATGGSTPFAGTSAGGTGIAPPVSGGASRGSFGGLINSNSTVGVNPQDTLVGPNDSDFGKDLNAELTETYNANPDLTFINRTYYEYYEIRNAGLAQLYTDVQTTNTLEDRLEAHIDFDTPIGDDPGSSKPASNSGNAKEMRQLEGIQPPLVFKNEIITGVAFKWLDNLGYGDYDNEFLNATDLSSGSYPIVNAQNFPGATPTYPIPGTNLYGSSGTAGNMTTAETAYEASAFFQHQITFTPQWMLMYSGRADAIFDRLSDPLPGVGVPSGIYDTTIQVLPTADVSVDYKPAPWVTAYTTFDYNQSTAGNKGGGFDSFQNGAQSVDYHYANYLYEGGLKFDLLDHTLSTTVDGYYQTHNVSNAFGDVTQVRTLGSELSTTYQPNKDLYFLFNESYLNATLVDPGGEFTENVYDAFSTNSTSVNGTGVGSPNFAAPPPGHYRESGLPQFLLTGSANFKLGYGFGASAGYTITDPIPTSEAENVWIPWQYEIDSSISYTYKNFSAKITFYNITDQRNFSSGGYISGTGNDLITIKEPFHAEGTLGYKF